MTRATKSTILATFANLRAGIRLDEAQALRAIDIIARRADFTPAEYLHIGAVIYTPTTSQDRALPYFVRAAEGLPPRKHSTLRLSRDMRNQGREDWAQLLEQANTSWAGAAGG